VKLIQKPFYLGHLQLSEIVNEPTVLKEFYKALQENGARKDKTKVNGELVLKKGGLSLKTIRHHHALLSSMFQSAIDWKLIKTVFYCDKRIDNYLRFKDTYEVCVDKKIMKKPEEIGEYIMDEKLKRLKSILKEEKENG
jgi:hypothetical protein